MYGAPQTLFTAEFMGSNNRVNGKIAEVRDLIDLSGCEVWLEVDGGIKVDNIASVAEAGADTFVAGSAIFGHSNYNDVIGQMKTQIAA